MLNSNKTNELKKIKKAKCDDVAVCVAGYSHSSADSPTKSWLRSR